MKPPAYSCRNKQRRVDVRHQCSEVDCVSVNHTHRMAGQLGNVTLTAGVDVVSGIVTFVTLNVTVWQR